ncbi:DNA polymerase I [Oscillatoria sp. FACHB-1406]|uniref:DNA polymerase I n=1 Tax=Oscillatoria sp. FACHB-1406 TaxID=2692846 RepID=UPI00168786A8|nr:DNA polymerase I [Oscillatoria sp. FACHB-1406]MBD2576428.1 DNA polymerase I [Oscillatoria sp. FACHB-1406]
MTSTAPLLLLIDGHSLAFRSYFAFAKGRDGGLRTSNGTPTNICFGFLKSLLQVMQAEQPQYLAVAFDLATPTFRHEADATYKADRPDAPEDFAPDLENLQRLLSALELPLITAPGYEADDILATLATLGREAGYRVKIASGDRDLFQLVDDERNVSILYFDNSAIKGYSAIGAIEFNAAAVEKKLGVKPTQIVDYKALCGDKSDNIPGVKGIGEKTAVKLLAEYDNLEAIYQNLDSIKGANQKKLDSGKQDAENSRYLAQLKFDVPIEIPLERLQLRGFDTTAVQPILEELELKRFIQQIDRIQEQFGGTIEPPPEAPEETTIAPEPDEEFEDEALWFFSAEDTRQAQKEEKALIEPLIVDTPEKLEQLIQQLKQQVNPQNPVAWDTETTSLEPLQSDLVGLGCAWGTATDNVAYIPLGHTLGTQLEKQQAIEALRPFLESEQYPKAFQNAKFDRLVLFAQDIQLRGVVFDTMLASYILNPDRGHSLSELSLRYLSGIESQSYKDLGIPKGKTIADLSISTGADYCGMDAYATYCLVEKLQAEFEAVPELKKLLLEVEQPLEPILAAMEERGIRIDIPYLSDLSQQLEKDLQEIEDSAYEAAGEKFNLGSPKQLSELLFDKLNLNRKKSRKIKTGYSTDHATLEKLQGDHPVIDRILEHRTLSKLKSTYVDALPALADPETHRVHTDFNQTVTSTGRLSSSNPNLQNIPVRSEFSRQIRKAFLPKSDWLLVSADYSQIELRILAHLSQEPVLLEAYQNSRDVHTVTAQLVFDKEKVTADERRLGKTINFGVIYGMGAQRFAREAAVSSAEGKIFIDKYRARYAKVFEFLESMKKAAIAQGYVTTILQRRRYFNFASPSLQKLRGSAPDRIELDKFTNVGQGDSQLLRAAANAPIQGSSADIIKLAMIQLEPILQNYRARLLLQVHDELVFEVPPEEWQELEPKIKATMEGAIQLSVPLVVEVRAGKNWMEAK